MELLRHNLIPCSNHLFEAGQNAVSVPRNMSVTCLSRTAHWRLLCVSLQKRTGVTVEILTGALSTTLCSNDDHLNLSDPDESSFKSWPLSFFFLFVTEVLKLFKFPRHTMHLGLYKHWTECVCLFSFSRITLNMLYWSSKFYNAGQYWTYIWEVFKLRNNFYFENDYC